MSKEIERRHIYTHVHNHAERILFTQFDAIKWMMSIDGPKKCYFNEAPLYKGRNMVTNAIKCMEREHVSQKKSPTLPNSSYILECDTPPGSHYPHPSRLIWSKPHPQERNSRFMIRVTGRKFGHEKVRRSGVRANRRFPIVVSRRKLGK